ncbi:hypothetical protein [Heyndrickxia faecalis]|uniref:hypothetical protein n=1 Tax=Heyndrickxia faecalis TaxID=2824910 RepID=UPI001B3A7843|nr:hypothetical protein [Heyndrickxia faecalis]MBQ4912425.1 hypothetical protein [Heyndrickxia faecalis]
MLGFPHLFQFPAALPVSEKDCSHAIFETNGGSGFAWIPVSFSIFCRGFLFWKQSEQFPATNGHRLCFTWISASISAFPPHFLFQKTDHSHAIFETNGHRLCLDFRIYFSFPVALPVSEKDCSHAFSATNEYHLCFAWISVSISVFRRTSEYRLLFWCGFPVLESILSGQTSGSAWLLDIRFFQLPPRFLFQKTDRSHAIFETNGHRLCLDFRIYFSFPVALPVSEKDFSQAISRNKWASALFGFRFFFSFPPRFPVSENG